MKNIEEVTLEEELEIYNAMEIETLDPENLPLGLFVPHRPKNVREIPKFLFTIAIVNSKKEEVDRVEVETFNEDAALAKAERHFLEKNENYTLADSGMFLGSNIRDLCVKNNETGKNEDFKLVIYK